MVLFVTESVVLFRNETHCRRFRRNVREGVKKCPDQQLKLQFNNERWRRRGNGLDSEKEGGFTVYLVQKDVLEKAEGVGKCPVPSTHAHKITQGRSLTCMRVFCVE